MTIIVVLPTTGAPQSSIYIRLEAGGGCKAPNSVTALEALCGLSPKIRPILFSFIEHLAQVYVILIY